MIDDASKLIGKTIQDATDITSDGSLSSMLLLIDDGSVFRIWAHGSDDYCQLYVDEYVDPTIREDLYA